MKNSVEALAEQLWKFKFVYDKDADWEEIKAANPVNSAVVIEAAKNMIRIAGLVPREGNTLDLRLKSSLISK